MPRIKEDCIARVLAAVRIEDVVGSYFPLRRASKGFVLCCPFHAERTPSCHITPAKNTFKCFGCGKGGSVVTFVMEHEGIPFPDAVRKLAARVGIAIEEEPGQYDTDESLETRARLLAVHRDVTAWMHRLLLTAPEAAPARAYLEQRGMHQGVWERWAMGYAPPERSAWRAAGHSSADLLEAGIFAENEHRPGNYPRFRDRLMFPIRNDHGDTIAYSGRILQDGASPAKYLNSPETPIFRKSACLFALDAAKKAIHARGECIVVEGQIDAIRMHEAGLPHTVAPLGTAITADHARALRRHTEALVLCLDGDAAGANAAVRAWPLWAAEGLFPRICQLPAGEDPDTLLRHGPADLQDMLTEAPDYLEWWLARQDKPHGMHQRIRLLRAAAEQIAAIPVPAIRREAATIVALSLDCDSDDLLTTAAGVHPEDPPAAPSLPAMLAAAADGAEDDSTDIHRRRARALADLAAARNARDLPAIARAQQTLSGIHCMNEIALAQPGRKETP